MQIRFIPRRRFLQGSGAAIFGSLSLATGPIALLAPARAWALELSTLDEHQGKTLLQFTRHLYPHESLEDAVYALVVKDLDEGAGKDDSVHQLLTEGVAGLDQAAGGDWLAADEAKRFAEVKALEGTAFFEKVRSTAVVSLYSNELAFAHFGYPGPKGNSGYLHRGFNDLKWLDEPPASASGPIPA